MSKYKICPSCGKENDPRSLECKYCDADLMSVRVFDPDMPIQAEVEKVPEEQNESPLDTDGTNRRLVRICYCGEINPAQARKCKNCNEDISDVVPVAQEAEIEQHYQLSSIGENYVYDVPCGNMVIGREHGMRECLVGKQYVSRIHAKLTVENGKLYIENLSTTNYTYVNNIRIPNGKTQLSVGDEIALGGISINGSRQPEAAYFIVGISV